MAFQQRIAGVELRPGVTLDIQFDPFTARLAFLCPGHLKLRIVRGENEGFEDTVSYELRWLQPNVAVLSWRERIGSTVVHIIDGESALTCTFVTPASGGFLRLDGKISVLS